MNPLKLAKLLPFILSKMRNGVTVLQLLILFMIAMVMYITGLSLWGSVDVIIENLEMFQKLSP